MLQKQKNIAWILAVSLIAMSIAIINSFGTPEKYTYAKSLATTSDSSPTSLSLIRPSSSQVGSVFVINVTQATLICVAMPNQNVSIPVPGNFTAKDHIYLVRFPVSNCDISTISSNVSKFIDVKHISDLNGQSATISSDAKQKSPLVIPPATT